MGFWRVSNNYWFYNALKKPFLGLLALFFVFLELFGLSSNYEILKRDNQQFCRSYNSAKSDQIPDEYKS